MHDLIIVLVVAAALLGGLHMSFVFRSGGYAGPNAELHRACGCGHASAFHKDAGGCRHTHDGSTDCYGYCTCQRTYAQVVAAEGATIYADRPGADAFLGES